MAADEHLVGDGRPRPQQFLRDGCDVAVGLADGGHEQVLLAGNAFLHGDHPVDRQNPRHQVAPLRDGSGTKQQHPQRMARLGVVHRRSVPPDHTVVLQSSDPLADRTA